MQHLFSFCTTLGRKVEKDFKKWSQNSTHILGFLLPSETWEHAPFSWENSSVWEISPQSNEKYILKHPKKTIFKAKMDYILMKWEEIYIGLMIGIMLKSETNQFSKKKFFQFFQIFSIFFQNFSKKEFFWKYFKKILKYIFFISHKILVDYTMILITFFHLLLEKRSILVLKGAFLPILKHFHHFETKFLKRRSFPS